MKAERQTRLKLRKGFHKAPLVYKVLSVNQLSEKDAGIVIRTVGKLTNPAQAKLLVKPGSLWGYRVLSNFPPEAGIVTYRGVHVALFFKRTTEDVVPEPSDPVPAGALENPDDVWVRFDLMGKSARQMLNGLRKELDDLKTDYAVLQAELAAANRLVAANEHTIATLRGKLKEKK